LEEYLKTVERQIIEQALEVAEGNQTRASQILQVSYRSLRHRLDTLGLKKRTKERSGERREGEGRRTGSERRMLKEQAAQAKGQQVEEGIETKESEAESQKKEESIRKKEEKIQG
jgi:hypothetical protein